MEKIEQVCPPNGTQWSLDISFKSWFCELNWHMTLTVGLHIYVHWNALILRACAVNTFLISKQTLSTSYVRHCNAYAWPGPGWLTQAQYCHGFTPKCLLGLLESSWPEKLLGSLALTMAQRAAWISTSYRQGSLIRAIKGKVEQNAMISRSIYWSESLISHQLTYPYSLFSS